MIILIFSEDSDLDECNDNDDDNDENFDPDDDIVSNHN